MTTLLKTSPSFENLPAVTPETPSPSPGASGEESRGQTIHVIDPDSAELISLFETLSHAGFRVSASSSVGDALGYIERDRPQVVIARMELEGSSGLSLIDRVKAASPQSRVILTSGRTDWSLYEEVRRQGGSDLVARPVRPLPLLRAVERAIAG
jgi:FixJ family two-component response regulator